jgi:hypothetical protein
MAGLAHILVTNLQIPPTIGGDGVITTIKRTKKQFLAWDEDPGRSVTLTCHESLLPALVPMSEGAAFAWLKRDSTAWSRIVSSLTAVDDDKDVCRSRKHAPENRN